MKKRFIFIIVFIGIFFSIFFYDFNPNKEQRVFKVAIISYAPITDSILSSFTKELKILGYAEYTNLEIIYNGYIDDRSKLATEAEKLVSLNPDVLYAISTPAALAVKKLAVKNNIPIVFGPVNSPEKVGLIRSIKDPGKNITGITFGPQEERRFGLLQQFDPSIKNVLVPYSVSELHSDKTINELETKYSGSGIRILRLPLQKGDSPIDVIREYKDSYDAIYIPTDPTMVFYTEDFSRLAIEKKVILTSPHREGVSKGALYSFGFSTEDIGKQAARMVSMVLNGTPVESIPVEFSEFNISVNLDTADKIGVNVPEYLLINSFVVRY